MTFENIRYEIVDHIAVIGLNRRPVNALSLEFIDEIIAALRQAGEDDKVRVVIIKSELDDIFCAGLEISAVKGVDGQGLRSFLERLYLELNDVQYRLGKPSIAAVEGAARAGGMTVAVSCNMVIAGENASFGYPEINVGLIPALHFVHLPRVAGRHRALNICSQAMILVRSWRPIWVSSIMYCRTARPWTRPSNWHANWRINLRWL